MLPPRLAGAAAYCYFHIEKIAFARWAQVLHEENRSLTLQNITFYENRLVILENTTYQENRILIHIKKIATQVK
jgi:hypothetical protein